MSSEGRNGRCVPERWIPFFARVCGIYPFVWDEETSAPRKSLPLQLWGYVSLIATLGVSVARCYWSLVEKKNDFQEFGAPAIVWNIQYNSAIISFAIIHIILWFQQNKFGLIVTKFRLSRLKSASSKWLTADLVFGCVTTIIISIIYTVILSLNSRNTFETILDVYSYLTFFFLVNYIRSTQIAILILLKSFVNEQMQPFKQAFENHVLNAGYPVKVTHLFPVVKKNKEPSVKDLDTYDMSATPNYDDLNSVDFEDLEKGVIDSFNLLRLLSNYLDEAIAVLMLSLLFWLLGAVYFCVTMDHLPGVMRYFFVFQLIYTLLPMLSLMNANHNFNTLVSCGWSSCTLNTYVL